MAHAGPDLSQLLTVSGVTVLSCVPTLLSMLAEDVPTLRLIILGGEACAEQLVERWARPGRRMLNTSGPTETTVIATYADMSPGKPVTTGRAGLSHRVHPDDDELPGGPQLVGYLGPNNGAVDQEGLRSHLRSRLPAYMVPALFEILPDLPRLPSGKLDRASLPAPRPRDTTTPATGQLPQTDTERRIAQVWELLFRPQRVSVDDDFFLDLGGHSLLAAR